MELEQRRFRNKQLLIFLLCWAAYAMAYFGRVNLSVAIPDIGQALGIDKTRVGLIGTSLFWVYGVGQLINGMLGDRIPSRVFVFIGLAVTGLANLLFGFSNLFLLMMLLWSVNGYFQSTLWGPISKTLSVWYDRKNRSRAAIALSTSMVVGYLLAWGVGGKLLAAGWRWVFWAPGVALLLFAPVWLLWMRSHPEDAGFRCPEEIAAPQTRPDGKRHSLLSVIVETRLWLVVAACLMQGLIKEGIGLWGPTFLMETHGLSMKSSAMVMLFIPLMNFTGMLLAGWLNGLVGHREKVASAILFLVAALGAAGLLWLGRVSIVLCLLFLGLASAAIYGVNTLLLGVLPLGFDRYGKVSSVAGFLDFCSYFAAGIATPVTGAMAEALGWNSAVLLWAAASAVGMGLLLYSRRVDRRRGETAAIGLPSTDGRA